IAKDEPLEENMPSTHLSLHYHLVFSTKDRLPVIDKEWRGRLHSYLGAIVRELGGVPQMIGGVADHVHGWFSALCSCLIQRPCRGAIPGGVDTGGYASLHHRLISSRAFSAEDGRVCVE
ncbi:MAG: transposase, partial [Blastocatellia bacterium]|nr:transposase [Blastocatellia bacterium]